MSRARERAAAAWPYLLVALAPLFWSGNVVVGRALRDQVDPIALTCYRWAIAGILVLPFAWRALYRHRRELLQAWPVIAGLGLSGLVAFQTCVYYAVHDTPALNALLILQATPVVILLGAAALFGERLTRRRGIAIVIAAAGALVLVTRGRPAAVLAMDVNGGDLWMLLAVALWATYSLLLKRRPRAVPQTALLAACIVVGLSVLLPAWWLSGAAAERSPLSPQALAGVFYIGIFASFLALLCWNTGVARLGPGTAGMFMYLMPVYGAVLGYLLLGEGIAGFHLVGAALIFGGLGLMQPGAPAGPRARLQADRGNPS